MNFWRSLTSHLRDVLKKDGERPHPFIIERAGLVSESVTGTESFIFIYDNERGSRVRVEVVTRPAQDNER